jgi:hypothetical protein
LQILQLALMRLVHFNQRFAQRDDIEVSHGRPRGYG